MTNALRSDQDYELFIYTLAERFPSIQHTTLTFVRRGLGLARVAGEIHFAHRFRIVVRERLLYHHLPMLMDWYGYEVWQGAVFKFPLYLEPDVDDYMSRLAERKGVDMQVLVNEWLRSNIQLVESVQ